MEALEQESWIDQKGSRPAKPGWPSELYEITLKGKAALELDEKSIEDFLKTATGEQLQTLAKVKQPQPLSFLIVEHWHVDKLEEFH